MRASSALTSTSASAPVGSGVAPTGVAGPASRTAERRRRVGVGAGAWKSGLRLGTTGLAGVPAAAWSSPSSSSATGRRRGGGLGRRGVELRAASTVAACSVGWAPGPSRRARFGGTGLLSHQLLEGRRGALGRLGRLGVALAREARLRRSAAAFWPPGRWPPEPSPATSEPAASNPTAVAAGCGGVRASRRQGPARPPEQPPPSSSCAWQPRARGAGPGRRRRRLGGLGAALSALAARRSEEGRCVGQSRWVSMSLVAIRQPPVECGVTTRSAGAVNTALVRFAVVTPRLRRTEVVSLHPKTVRAGRGPVIECRRPSRRQPLPCLTGLGRTTGRSALAVAVSSGPCANRVTKGDAAAAARRSRSAVRMSSGRTASVVCSYDHPQYRTVHRHDVSGTELGGRVVAGLGG